MKTKIKKYNSPKSQESKKKSQEKESRLLKKKRGLLSVAIKKEISEKKKKKRVKKNQQIKLIRRKIHSQEMLEKYFKKTQIDHGKFGKLLRKIKRWEKFLEKFKKGLRLIFKLTLRFSFRAAVF